MSCPFTISHQLISEAIKNSEMCFIHVLLPLANPFSFLRNRPRRSYQSPLNPRQRYKNPSAAAIRTATSTALKVSFVIEVRLITCQLSVIYCAHFVGVGLRLFCAVFFSLCCISSNFPQAFLRLPLDISRAVFNVRPEENVLPPSIDEARGDCLSHG